MKTELKFFDITEFEKEQEYLRAMHRKGWKLSGIWFPGIYRFEECTPEDVVYQLDYNRDGVAHKEEYVQMFEDCGWEYLTEFVGYTYFRKPVSRMQSGEEEIFCDDSSRLEMWDRIFKGRMIPLLAVFFCIIVPQLLAQFSMGGTANYVLAAVYVLLLILYLSIFVKFAVRSRALRKKSGA